MNSMKRHALAAACVLVRTGAQALIIVTGDVGTGPTPAPIGPGDTSLPGHKLYIAGLAGEVSVLGGSLLDLGSVYMAGSASARLNIAGVPAVACGCSRTP